MGLEIGGGLASGSLGLLAEGVHMAAHVGVLAAAALAYAYARRRDADERFTFGVGRIGDLVAFASGTLLALVALLIVVESVQRLAHPAPASFAEALPIAILGLIISLISAALLGHHPTGAMHAGGSHAHSGHAHAGHVHAPGEAAAGRSNGAANQDLNIRAAYLHLLSDAAVSILAILGLLLGRYLGWLWADPVAGLCGAAVVAQFSLVLMRGAGASLVDVNPDLDRSTAIRRRLEALGGQVYDLHLWRLGPGHQGLIVSIAAAEPRAPSWYRALLQSEFPGLSHITIEIEPLGAHAASTSAPSASHATTGHAKTGSI